MFSFVLASAVLQGALPRAGGPMVRGTEAIMAPKAHGTSPRAVPRTLRWNVDRETASHISSFNRHYAEPSGSAYGSQTTYLATIKAEPTIYYDSVTGDPLFVAPRGRTLQEFLDEGKAHGWPSFRDEEVVWESVRVLPDGETVSTAGTHLGHNIPDQRGNRYCINLCSVAHQPPVRMTERSVRDALRNL